MRSSLTDDQPDILRPARRLDARKLLRRHCVDCLVEHRAEIVGVVNIANARHIRAVLEDLLHTPVQIPDHRGALGHRLAVQRQHQAQHAVSRGVLRPHVEDHLLAAQAGDVFILRVG